MDASVDFTGNTQSRASAAGVTDDATNSGGLLLNYRYYFHGRAAVEANGAFTTFTQYYSPAQTVTQANVYEATGALVYNLRDATARLRPFLEAGGGALIFSPYQPGSNSGNSRQIRPAILYGAGFDFRAFRHYYLRLGYRGLFYKAPDFNSAQQHTGVFTHMAEPYLGVALRF
jgi:hypothetical protein